MGAFDRNQKILRFCEPFHNGCTRAAVDFSKVPLSVGTTAMNERPFEQNDEALLIAAYGEPLLLVLDEC